LIALVYSTHVLSLTYIYTIHVFGHTLYCIYSYVYYIILRASTFQDFHLHTDCSHRNSAMEPIISKNALHCWRSIRNGVRRDSSSTYVQQPAAASEPSEPATVDDTRNEEEKIVYDPPQTNILHIIIYYDHEFTTTTISYFL